MSLEPSVRAAAIELSSVFDVPLAFNESEASAKAIAKILRRPNGEVELAYVEGNPTLRAVLFEGFQTPAGLAYVQRLLAAIGEAELMIVLRQQVSQGAALTGETREQYSLMGAKLVIARDVILGAPLGGAVSDAGVERSRRHDAGHLRRLQASPAYNGPIRKRRLF